MDRQRGEGATDFIRPAQYDASKRCLHKAKKTRSPSSRPGSLTSASLTGPSSHFPPAWLGIHFPTSAARTEGTSRIGGGGEGRGYRCQRSPGPGKRESKSHASALLRIRERAVIRRYLTGVGRIDTVRKREWAMTLCRRAERRGVSSSEHLPSPAYTAHTFPQEKEERLGKSRLTITRREEGEEGEEEFGVSAPS